MFWLMDSMPYAMTHNLNAPHKGSVKSTLGLFEQGKPYASLASQYPCGF